MLSDDPDAGVTTIAYDDLDRPTSTTDSRGETISSVYDELGRVTSTWEGEPNTGTQLTERVYDTFYKGYETGVISYADGFTTTIAYASRHWDYQPISTTYHLTGSALGDLAGSYSSDIGYNLDGSVANRSWDPAADLVNDGVTYTRDELGRITQARRNTSNIYAQDIFYEPTGELSSLRYPMPATTIERTFLYDDADRLSQVWLEADDTAGSVSDITYDYDDAGNVQSIIDAPTAAGSERDAQCFTYDYLRRLTEAWTSPASGTDATACAGGPSDTGTSTGDNAYWHTYGFDLAGNRTSKTMHSTTGGTDTMEVYTYPAPGGDQPHALSTVTTGGATTADYVYDDAGNTTQVTRGSQTQDFTWDATGRLETVTTTPTATAAINAPDAENPIQPSTNAVTDVPDGEVSFEYDANGNRLLRTDPGGTTLYLPGTELRYNSDTGTITGTRYIDLPGGATLVKTAATQQLQFTDHHGTGTTAFNCATGEVTRRYLDPYGNPRTTATGGWLGEKGFVGGTIDPTGLTHLGARDYDPQTGRFISADPLMDVTNPQQMNGYTYASGNPVSKSDASGLMEIDPVTGYDHGRSWEQNSNPEWLDYYLDEITKGGGSSGGTENDPLIDALMATEAELAEQTVEPDNGCGMNPFCHAGNFWDGTTDVAGDAWDNALTAGAIITGDQYACLGENMDQAICDAMAAGGGWVADHKHDIAHVGINVGIAFFASTAAVFMCASTAGIGCVVIGGVAVGLATSGPVHESYAESVAGQDPSSDQVQTWRIESAIPGPVINSVTRQMYGSGFIGFIWNLIRPRR